MTEAEPSPGDDPPLRVSTLELFRPALRIGPLRYRAAAAVAALAVSAVGLTVSVTAEIALLIVVVAAALAVEHAKADTVEP